MHGSAWSQQTQGAAALLKLERSRERLASCRCSVLVEISIRRLDARGRLSDREMLERGAVRRMDRPTLKPKRSLLPERSLSGLQVWGTPECPVSWCSNIAGLPLVNCFLMTNLKAAPGSDAPSAILGQTRPGCRGCICSVLVVAHRTSQAQCQRSPYSEASLQPSGLELGADSEALAFFAWTLRVRSG